jgi:cytoskeletal protein CcmA (bactofilin family)
MKFLSRPQEQPASEVPETTIGIGSTFRGTMMVSGTLRIDGEVEGDILNCDRLDIGEHGTMRADIEVKDAIIRGNVIGNLRVLGVLELKTGAHLEGDVAAHGVVIEPGVYFMGRCTMIEPGTEDSYSSRELVTPADSYRG